MNKKSKITTYSKVIIHMALLLLAAVLLVSVNMQSHQAMRSFSLPLTFEGVYSQNGEEWKTLEENTGISALDGDLVLRLLVFSAGLILFKHIPALIRIVQGREFRFSLEEDITYKLDERF